MEVGDCKTQIAYNLMQFSTKLHANDSLENDQTVVSPHLLHRLTKTVHHVKVVFITGLFYLVALSCTGDPLSAIYVIQCSPVILSFVLFCCIFMSKLSLWSLILFKLCYIFLMLQWIIL